jgi:DNA-binding response OmpR family regulator
MLEMTLSSMTLPSKTLPSATLPSATLPSATISSMTLISERIKVFSAISLSSALLQLRVLQPNLIIVGSDGPGMSMGSAVAQIKALSDVPLLLLGHETAVMTVAGVDDTLRYPLDAGELCAKVAGSLCGS